MVFTKIHGKYYNLAGYDHPGGPVALSLADSRDATELFESHHLFSDKSKLASILKKYEVQESECNGVIIPSCEVYDWEKTLTSEFTKELKAMAIQVLGNDIKADTGRWCQYFFIVSFALLQFYFFVRGYWFSVLTYPVSLWIFFVHIFHDASHFAMNKNWRVNSFGMNAGFNLATPYHWYHQHIVGHHSFPNVVGKDPDLYHVTPIIRHTSDIPVTFLHSVQHYVFFYIEAFFVPTTFLIGGGILCMLGYPYNGVVSLVHTAHLNVRSIPLRLTAYIFLMHVLPVWLFGCTQKGLVFALLPQYIFSWLFLICTQVNHLVPETVDEFDSNFFINQIVTGHNINTSDFLTTLFTGGLNMQIEHHLFPSVNHCHLHKLAPHVKALCAKHGVAYAESASLWEAVGKHMDHLYNMGFTAVLKSMGKSGQ